MRTFRLSGRGLASRVMVEAVGKESGGELEAGGVACWTWRREWTAMEDMLLA